METQQFLQNVLLPFMKLHYKAKPTYLFFPPYENIVTYARIQAQIASIQVFGYMPFRQLYQPGLGPL